MSPFFWPEPLHIWVSRICPVVQMYTGETV